MSKAIAQLTESLNKLNESLETLKTAKQVAEDRLRDEQMYIENCENDIRKVEAQVVEKTELIEAMQEDLAANKIAAQGFLSSISDEETQLNFMQLCETLGIEIEIEADENTSEDEARETAGEVVQIAT